MMNLPTTLELLEFNLKLLGTKRKKRILVSAGKLTDKKLLLPDIKRLLKLQVEIFTTSGTHEFLLNNKVETTKLHKISDKTIPNISTYLKDNRFDLIVNILTNDNNYDEDTDSKLIRKKSIQNGIPLITDCQIAMDTFKKIVIDVKKGTYKPAYSSLTEPWNMKAQFMHLVMGKGGLTNHHAHFDKSYLITKEILELSQVDMQKKWELYKYIKENYTHDDLVQRISRGVEAMIHQGVVYCRTMVDADSTVGLLPIKAALEVKKLYYDKITFEVGVQPLQGVLDPASFEQYEEACKIADYCGGLPSKDRPQPEKHLDVILELARKLNKSVDVHVDQENNPLENETELLALKTIEHGMQGKVFGVHAISLAAKEEYEQDRIIDKIVEANLGIIICPSAAISMKQLAMNSPLHNSIAPFPKLLKAGVRCYLGVDNVHDLFMPMVDGDIWTECRMLMEACRIYDLDAVSDLACAITRDQSFVMIDKREYNPSITTF
jgi:cytosine/adenosine deaminase-related metal-dependent hydrolase